MVAAASIGCGTTSTDRAATPGSSVPGSLPAAGSTSGTGPTSTTGTTGTDWPALRRNGATYEVADPLPVGRPGEVIAVSDEGADPAVGGVDRRVVLYHSTNAAGADIAVSGVVFVPAGAPPAAGWPVISWAHGTTGIADRCAPSEIPNLFYNEYAQLARLWVQHGYAVVATDYTGLGTPGTHSYLVGVDEGNAVIDIVTAARHLDDRLSTTWFGVGHSQGGQAVLFATRNAPTRDPALHLGATVSIAPASGLKLILPAVIAGIDTSDLSYAVYSLIGLSTVDSGLHLDEVFGPVGKTQLPIVLDDACLDQTDPAFTSVTPDQTFRLTADEVTRLSAELDRYDDPDTQPTTGPVLVIQGATDQDVPPPVTATAVANLEALGSDVTEKIYPDLNHDQVVGPSSCDALDWLAAHGGPPTGACSPQPSEK